MKLFADKKLDLIVAQIMGLVELKTLERRERVYFGKKHHLYSILEIKTSLPEADIHYFVTELKARNVKNAMFMAGPSGDFVAFVSK